MYDFDTITGALTRGSDAERRVLQQRVKDLFVKVSLFTIALMSQLPLCFVGAAFALLAYYAAPGSLAWILYVYTAALSCSVVARVAVFRANDYWTALAKSPRTGQRPNAVAGALLFPLLLIRNVVAYQSRVEPLPWTVPGAATAPWWPLPRACRSSETCSAKCVVYVCRMPETAADLPMRPDVLLDLDTDTCIGAGVRDAVRRYEYMPCFPGTLPCPAELYALLTRIAADKPENVCVCSAHGRNDARALIVAALLLTMLHKQPLKEWREHYATVRTACGIAELEVKATVYQAALVDCIAPT
jgi:hypothetical protein